MMPETRLTEKSMAKKNAKTVNETRQEMGLVPVAGGDVPGSPTTPIPPTAELPSGNAQLPSFVESGAVETLAGSIRRLNLPRMLLPKTVPVGSVVRAKVVRVTDSPASQVKGKCLWMQHAKGEEFLLPVTGTIRSALAPGVEVEKIAPALEKWVGKTLVVKRLANGFSGKYKREMYVFDVWEAAE